jgi:hypothetical protein
VLLVRRELRDRRASAGLRLEAQPEAGAAERVPAASA